MTWELLSPFLSPCLRVEQKKKKNRGSELPALLLEVPESRGADLRPQPVVRHQTRHRSNKSVHNEHMNREGKAGKRAGRRGTDQREKERAGGGGWGNHSILLSFHHC